ncbi:MAG: acyloxyacyl hydrolase [Oceanipulchritudo sp.]
MRLIKGVCRALLIAGVVLLPLAGVGALWDGFAVDGDEVLLTVTSSDVLVNDELELGYVGLEFRRVFRMSEAEPESPWRFYVSAYVNQIHTGPGNYIIGGSGGVRWLCRFEESGIDTYVQASLGIVGNDAYKDMTQNGIGNFLEFRDVIGIGIGVPVKGQRLHAEMALEHISNAGLARRNGGVNLMSFGLGIEF